MGHRLLTTMPMSDAFLELIILVLSEVAVKRSHHMVLDYKEQGSRCSSAGQSQSALDQKGTFVNLPQPPILLPTVLLKSGVNSDARNEGGKMSL